MKVAVIGASNKPERNYAAKCLYLCYVADRTVLTMKNIIFLLVLVFSCVATFSRPLWAQNETVIISLFKKQVDSIVVVGVIGKRKKDNRSGSGFFISQDGLILTNYHLIKKARRIFVKLKDDTAYTRVKVVNVDVPRDIAVLKIDASGVGRSPTKPVKLGNSDDLTVGQRVVAISNPLGLENTVSDGIISAIRPTDQGSQVLQVSVPLSNGSSGGPLFNLQGEVIGVVAASMQKGQSLNFVIPINEVKPRLVRFFPDGALSLAQPAPTAPPAAKPTAIVKEKSYRVYVIQPNDTLWGLAERFDTSVNALMKINNLKTSKIFKGQKIKIP